MHLRPLIPVLAFFFAADAASGNPEVSNAISQSFGSQAASQVLLVKGTATTSEPAEWTAYAVDAFRPEDILRISVRMEGSQWKATPAGAGNRILSPIPPKTIPFARLRVRSSEARAVAAKAAALAHTTFASVDYQLAAQPETGAPEWGLALKDDTGHEVGFCVVSAETGALSFQDWTPRFSTTPKAPESEGERAAKAVKQTARKAWNWTDKARTETKNFFRELFR